MIRIIVIVIIRTMRMIIMLLSQFFVALKALYIIYGSDMVKITRTQKPTLF